MCETAAVLLTPLRLMPCLLSVYLFSMWPYVLLVNDLLTPLLTVIKSQPLLLTTLLYLMPCLCRARPALLWLQVSLVVDLLTPLLTVIESQQLLLDASASRGEKLPRCIVGCRGTSDFRAASYDMSHIQGKR